MRSTEQFSLGGGTAGQAVFLYLHRANDRREHQQLSQRLLMHAADAVESVTMGPSLVVASTRAACVFDPVMSML
jgi:hypothetical protein